MGAAVGPAVAFLTSANVAAVIIRTILLNVLIGGLEFEADGQTWVSCDE